MNQSSNQLTLAYGTVYHYAQKQKRGDIRQGGQPLARRQPLIQS